MKRVMISFLALVLAAGFLAGCSGGKGASPGPQDSKKKVTLLHYFSGTLSGGVQEMVETFNKKSAAFELVATPLDHEAYKTSIRETLDSRRSPDLYSYWAGARTRSVLDKLEPLDDVWQAAGLPGSVSPSVDAACTYDGKKYLIPITQHYVCFFYNKKVFAAAGVEPPRTWPEFLAACQRLKASGVTPIALGAKEKWPAQFWFDYLLLGTAGYEYRQRLMDGKASYADPEVRRVFALWSDLLAKGYFNTRPVQVAWDSGADQAVFTGEAAMTLMGTWIIGDYTSRQWRQGEDYDYFAFPVVDENVPLCALGAIDGLVLSKNAVQKQGAKEALTYLASVDSLKAMSRGSGAFVPHLGTLPNFYSPMQQRMLKEIQTTPHWVFNYDLSASPQVAAAGLNLFIEFLELPEQQEEIITRAAAKIQGLSK
ncbi:MAG: extracellular solute-binding protein [Negativicutes bacterium]|nr:extracellular solute-binding protein [Negativicutes bacterium]